MTMLEITHVLLFIVVFLLYLMSNCGCSGNGFNVGGQPIIKPVIPTNIKRLPWKKTSILLGRDSSIDRIFISNNKNSMSLTMNPIINFSNNIDLYHLAQYGFSKITLWNYPGPKWYGYEVTVDLNLTDENILGGIKWDGTYYFMMRFFIRAFINNDNFIKGDGYECDNGSYNLKISKFLNVKEFNGKVDFDITGNIDCPPLTHYGKSPETQRKECKTETTKDYCAFDDGTIINSCDNICNNQSNDLHIELYRIDLDIVEA